MANVKERSPRKGPRVFFSASKPENPACDLVELTMLHPVAAYKPNTKMEVLAKVCVAGLPGAGFIHICPTVEQIDMIVDSLLELRRHLSGEV